MRRGEAAVLAAIDSQRASAEYGFREVASDMRRIESTLVNLAADFRLHVADGHALDNE